MAQVDFSPCLHNPVAKISYSDLTENRNYFNYYVYDVDGGGLSEEAFNSLSKEEKMEIIIQEFGPEVVPTIELILSYTHLHSGFHAWGDGFAYRVFSENKLRPALERAYNKHNVKWTENVII
jgi:hypothetical protein